jgi:hypothetical protein
MLVALVAAQSGLPTGGAVAAIVVSWDTTKVDVLCFTASLTRPSSVLHAMLSTLRVLLRAHSVGMHGGHQKRLQHVEVVGLWGTMRAAVLSAGLQHEEGIEMR